jgi:uncharacterized protein
MKDNDYINLNISEEIIKVYLDSAKDRIESAKILLEEGQFRDAVSRSYYAFLDSARAALLTKKKTAKTHAGVLTLFGLEFGKTKKVPIEIIRLYHKVQKAREEADYELLRNFSKEETEEIIEMAEKFVNFIEKELIKG